MSVITRLIPTVAAGFLPLFVVASFSPLIAEEFHLSASGLGLATALFFGTSALTAGTIGPHVSERMGAVRTLRLSMVGVGFLMGVIGATRNAVELRVVLSCCGVLNGTIQPASNQVIADHVGEDRTGTTIGVKQAAIPLSGMLVGASLPTLLPRFGWRGTALLLGFSCLAVGLVSAGAPFEAVQGRPVAESRLRRRSFVPIALAGLFGNMASNSLATFFVPGLVQAGVSSDLAGVLLLIGSLVAILGRIVWGAVGDRRPALEMNLVTTLLAIGAGGIALFAFEMHTLRIVVATVLAFGAGWAWTGVVVSSVVRAHPTIATSATGFVMAGGLVGGVIGPLVFGYVADIDSFDTAWLMAALFMFVAAILMRANEGSNATRKFVWWRG